MLRRIAALLAALSVSFAAYGQQSPDDTIVTGPSFQQKPVSSLLITPPGGSQVQLGNAFLPLTGGTVSGAINTTSSSGYKIYGNTTLWLSNNPFYASSPQVAVTVGPYAGAALPANAQWLAAVGAGSFEHMTADNEGAGLGEMSCNSVTTGQNMTCVGMHSIGQETTASNDTATGNDSMRNTAGSNGVTTSGVSSHRNGSGNYDTVSGMEAMKANASSITITGTPTTGDVISITLSTSITGLTNLPATANYTVQSGDTLTSIATGIANAIKALPKIGGGNGGVMLTAFTSPYSGGPATVGLDFPGTSTTGWSITINSSVTGAGTETVTTAGGYTGYGNDVTGYQALFGEGLTTARYLVVHGYGAMPFATTAQLGVCEGASCGYNITTDYQFDISGFNAGYSLAGGTYNNTFHGSQAGYGVTTGVANTLIGAADNSWLNCVTTGNYNVELGVDACVASPTGGGQLSIQNIIYGSGNSAVGTNNSTGVIGIAASAPNATLTIGDAGGNATHGAHLGVLQTTQPTVTNGTLDTTGADMKGTITLTAANPVVTFTKTFQTTPDCVISSPSGTAFTYSVSTTALTLTGGASGNTVSYVCVQ